MPNIEEVKKYYDEHISSKLGGFVNGNERVERAWLTIFEHSIQPDRILEIGCGIGDICWRMSRHWLKANVVGLDVSSKSIEVANQLFGSDKIMFSEGLLAKGKLEGKFDLIVLMDVYEHIAVTDRTVVHDAIKNLLTPNGRVILSFPAPRHLSWLKKKSPEHIQPVDEDITIDTISQLAKDIDKEVLLYKEVSVWHIGDYAHAVLGSRHEWVLESDRPQPTRGLKYMIKRKIKEKIFGTPPPLVPPKEEKKILVKNKLGIDL